MKKNLENISLLVLLFAFAFLASCSKSSSGSGNSGTGGGGTDTVVSIPSNIVDIKSGSSEGLTLNPYSGFPPVASLIPVLGIGYYYISLQESDSVTFIIAADSSGGGNASVDGQTSDSGPNYFTTGDSLQFLVKAVEYMGQFDTVTDYFTKDLQVGYTLTSTDTVNFSGSYNGAVIYNSTLGVNTGYNLYNIQSYIAFRLLNASGSRYGWMLMSSDPSAGNLLTVLEIAFNKNYNQPIAIGKYQ
jgi:hypothetical protein